MSFSVVSCFFLIFCFAAFCPSYAATGDAPVAKDNIDGKPVEAALLLVWKRFEPLVPVAVVGNNLTVKLEIFNVGQKPAYNIEIDDVEAWGPDFELVEGNMTGSFTKLNPNSNVIWEYIIVPHKEGKHIGKEALVKYAENPSEEAKFWTQSSHAYDLEILSRDRWLKSRFHYKEWAFFLILSFVPVGLPAFIYAFYSRKLQQLQSSL